MPEELLGNGVPGPIGSLCISKDDARAGVLIGIIAPHVPVALARVFRRSARALEPRMLIRRVVDDELRDDLEVARVRSVEKVLEIVDRPVGGIDRFVG